MLRFLYVTDLHGWEAAYEAVLDAAVARGIPYIVNGGDMLPKGSGILKAQKRFIQGFLRAHVARCQATGVRFYGMFGNDDLASRLPYWREVLAEHPCAADLTAGWHEWPEGLRLRGVNHVPDHPFGIKDWSVMDTRAFTPPAQWSAPILSGPEGFEKIPDLHAFLAGRPTLAERLAAAGREAPELSRAILVSHCPPAGLGLAVTGGLTGGRDVGSVALRGWIERWQPLLTLHGHIHESPEMTGVHTATLGRTLCHQPGQRGAPELTLSMVEIAGEAVRIEREVLAVAGSPD
ncbi:MAG: Calcineurin-like phosphoesterase [Lentisphaerae bacterium ADurb.BinA184]|nr:MAG: Calcineurin-like phosphoesterase [Lentisphaerae bacterium ADurb.BinA184]